MCEGVHSKPTHKDFLLVQKEGSSEVKREKFLKSPAAAKLTQRPNSKKEEKMTQDERRIYLINELLKERNED